MPTFQHQEVIELCCGASLLRFAPQAGGRLLSWQFGGATVICWPDDANWSEVASVRGGNPLLFPFLGRHRVAGTLGRWKDAQGVVCPMPMHGFARELPFAGKAFADGRGVRMTLADGAATRAAYPFGFRFEAHYRMIDEATLEAGFVTTNTGSARLPWYAGHHFYFALPHAQRGRTRIALPSTRYCRQLPDGAISARHPGQAHYTFDDPAIVDRFHCLEGVPRAPVRIVAPGLGRTIEIDLARPGSIPWYAVTTWTQAPESDFYCVEPWLGLPDAIHNGQGLRWLEPGQTETATLRIVVRAG